MGKLYIRNKIDKNQINELENKRFNDFYQNNIDKFIEEIDLPTHVSFFKGINIKDILADGNNSFVITQDGNNLYFWGCNKFNKFNLPKENKKIIFKPYLFFSGSNFNNELYLQMDYLNNSFCLWECNII